MITLAQVVIGDSVAAVFLTSLLVAIAWSINQHMKANDRLTRIEGRLGIDQKRGKEGQEP